MSKAASEKMNGLSAIHIPHGLADPDGKFAYVVGQQGLIYRLDLRSGESRARTTNPGTPLAIQDDTLIGWRPDPDSANKVHLFAVSPQGDVLSPVWERTLTLPAWVETGSQEPEQFSLKAEIHDGELVITWEGRSYYSGGAPPPPEIEAAEARQASGGVRLNPKTGTILREEQQDRAPVTEKPLPHLPENRDIVPYLQGKAWNTHAWSANADEAFLVKIRGEPGILLVLRKPGSTASPVEIRLTEDPAAVAAVTPDGKFVFIHETRNDPASWHVFSVMDGEMIAKLPFDPGTQGISVVKDQVLYLVIEELGLRRHSTLHSRDIHTGQEMWSFTLEDGGAKTPPPLPR